MHAGFRVLSYVLAAGMCVPHLSWAAPKAEFVENSYITKPTKLWTEASQYGEPIATLDPGLTFDILTYSTDGTWMQIRTPAGREGWVPVRFTAMSGRRDTDAAALVARSAALKGRKPAGEGAEVAPDETTSEAVFESDSAAPPPDGGVEPTAAGPKVHKKKSPKNVPEAEVQSTRQLGAAIEFSQMISPEQSSGVALRPSVFFRFTEALWIGGGVDWGYNRRTQQDLIAALRVNRNLNRIQPNVAVRYGLGPVHGDMALGFDFQRTAITTTNLVTGLPVITDANGLLVTGSEWSRALGFRLSPTYEIPLNNGKRLGFTLSYAFRKEFGSGLGRFANANLGSSVEHFLGVGLALTTDF